MDVNKKGGKVPMDKRAEKSLWLKSERVEKSLCVIRKKGGKVPMVWNAVERSAL